MARSLDALNPFNVRWCRHRTRCVSGVSIAAGWVGHCWDVPLSRQLLAEQAPALASLALWATRLEIEGGEIEDFRIEDFRIADFGSHGTMAESEGRTQRGMVELEDARDMMELAAAALERWHRRLESISKELPAPEYADGTDDPLNLAAAWQGQLEALLQDDLEVVISTLRRLARWSEEGGDWRSSPPSQGL